MGLTYVIIAYDVDEKRVNKINKILKSYLIWVQNSVFEGNISQNLLQELTEKVTVAMKQGDSLIVYKLKSKSQIDRMIIGDDVDTNVI